jgi:intracellular sulfur oxidation DsrE/DsrF family protein
MTASGAGGTDPRDRIRVLGALAGLGATGLARAQAPEPAPADATWKVVMQISDSLKQAYEGLINVQNVLQIAPRVQFTVVGYGDAIRFLLNGTKAPDGALFSGIIGNLANQGVEFKACSNTLSFMKIPVTEVVLEASLIPVGVYELVRLQAAGWFYIKP